MESVHEPVLLHETVEALVRGRGESRPNAAPWYLDGTLGGAGHALAVAEALKGKLGIVGLDRDPDAIARAKAKLAGAAEEVILENASFRSLGAVLDKHGIAAVDMVLFDLGISSDQLDRSGRGFSFQRDEALHMTMGDPASHPFTAKDIVNGWEEASIADAIYAYGEERFARRIARAIVSYRAKKPIETSAELAEVVKGAVPALRRHGPGARRIHPATRTFQALRIAVNDELAALKDGLAAGYERLAPGGRMAVISFHSLEDRIVKEFFRAKAAEGAELASKKPVAPSDEEIERNPRSRSAKLRAIAKPAANI
ncbi:MAG: 16S rRNA (cytosine(1402)-N(4))-methyltransferase RsmH [Patescibacteria group bacterium]|nr:16S rRNA (cytosine(1402)-N(4))-methyltransferase RsmH [Patescibacteria group bacterium]